MNTQHAELESRRPLQSLLAVALVIGLALPAALAPSRARAQADVPFYAATQVEPNVLFVLDTSGSMGWDFEFLDGAWRTRMDAAKKIMTGRYSKQDKTDTNDGIIDVFGNLINFAFATYSGNASQNSASVISFPNGAGAVVFSNDDNPGLESTILAQSASGNTPTTHAMRDAACWVIGEDNWVTALNKVLTKPEGPEIPLIEGELVTSTSTSYINGAADCSNSYRDPAVYPCPGNAGCDPAFGCRRTFLVLLTDGDETSGAFRGGNSNLNDTNGDGVRGDPPHDGVRPLVAAAARRSEYLFPEAENSTQQGMPTYAVLFAPGGNTRLIEEGNQWGRYGGTDATPAVDDGSGLCKPNEDGNEAYIGNSTKEITAGIAAALQCVLSGNYTRAEPSFIASSTQFSENYEYDGFFEIDPSSPWWFGHLQAFTFDELNRAAKTGAKPQYAWDAGELLTNRVDKRKMFFASELSFTPDPVSNSDPAKGALVGPGQEPDDSQKKTVSFDTSATSISVLGDIMGIADNNRVAELVEFIRDEDGPGGTDVKYATGVVKTWSLGAIVNSTVSVVTPPFFDFRVGSGDEYADFIRTHANDPTMLYVGAQDATLHAFLGEEGFGMSPGEELWGFLPYEALLRIPSLHTGTVFTVDGSPTAAGVRFHNDPKDADDDEFKTVLIFGLRSGGFSYIALDITDPASPSLLWQVSHPTMGRTFSKPTVGLYKINWESAGSPVTLKRHLVAMGAGFNPTNQDGDPIFANPTTTDCDVVINGECGDNDPPPPELVGNTAADAGQEGIGNWVYFWDVETGRLVQNIKIADAQSNDPDNPDFRRNSIPGQLLSVDADQDGLVDNVVFGDIEGRLWKIITASPEPVDWRTNVDGLRLRDEVSGKPASPCLLYDPELDLSAEDATRLQGQVDAFDPMLMRRPIFYAPAATIDCDGSVNYVWGTGDLTDPNNTEVQEFLYAIKDRNFNGCGGQLPEMSAGDLTCEGQVTDDELLSAIGNSFPLALPNLGEKILSSPLITRREFHVSTYIPQQAGCGTGKGGLINAPAVCCGLVKDPDAQLDDVIVYKEHDKAGPPLILGPDGQIMQINVSSEGVEKENQIGELSRDRFLLHWVEIFGET